MPKSRRKSSSSMVANRSAAKKRRDALNLEYLRVTRDEARAMLGSHTEPLSVYSVEPFPLSYQFQEKKRKDGSRIYSYNKLPMPNWNDLTIRMKVELFILLCEEWNECLHTFNPHVHPDLITSINGKDIVSKIRDRARRRLDKMGKLARNHFFVVEGYDGKGVPTRLHIHGMAVVEGAKEGKAVKRAMGKAAGQESKGAHKLPSGNQGVFYQYKEGSSWGGYILKNIDKHYPMIKRKPYVFSRPAVQATKEFYNIITGQDF